MEDYDIKSSPGLSFYMLDLGNPFGKFWVRLCIGLPRN